MVAVQLVLAFCAGQLTLPVPNVSWPVSIKYQVPGQNGLCAMEEASSVFVRVPGRDGCNPTFNGNPAGFSSWYAVCPTGGSGPWSISWFNDNQCAGESALAELGPTGCTTNEKGETERFLCYEGFQAMEIFANRGRFSFHLALYSDADCLDESFFMYQFIIPNKCISNADDTSQLFVPGSITGTVQSYDNANCAGSPDDSSSEVPINYCFPYSRDPNDGSALAWGKILTFESDLVEVALPGTGARAPFSSAPVNPPSVTPPPSSNAHARMEARSWRQCMLFICCMGDCNLWFELLKVSFTIFICENPTSLDVIMNFSESLILSIICLLV